jgi:hypothetical protein
MERERHPELREKLQRRIEKMRRQQALDDEFDDV